ncbi:putative methyl-CpG DNA binding, DNA-binding domain superfamily [Helianthus debilis subsp. tardiflorus]
MSNSEPLPAGGEQSTPIILLSESDEEVATPTPDPLLGSGSFIDPNSGGHQKNGLKEAEIVTTPDPLLQNKTRPTWLPEGWDMIVKKRTSGATQGTFDRYYIAPSGRRLRSKNEVLNFLETGSKRKKPPTQSSEDTTSEGSAPRSKKKTTARKKVHAAFAFDFKSPPEKVSWRLTYASEDVWTPSIGDKNLPLATKQEWAAVFNHVCQN